MKTNKTIKLVLSLISVIAIFLLVSACSSGDKDEEESKDESESTEEVNRNLSLATPPVGVSYNSVGTGLAKVISQNSPTSISVKPTNGISAWGPQLNQGRIELGVGSTPDLAWAYRGENGYDRVENLRLLVRGNEINVTGAAVKESSSIESIADLSGKKVAAEYPGSVIAKQVLEAALTVNGLTWEDVQGIPTPTTAAGIEGIQDNQIEAAFALAPATPVSQEVHNAVGLRSISFLDDYSVDEIDDVSQETSDQIALIVPGASLTIVKENGYITEDQIGIKYPSEMVTSTHLSDEVAYEIMETLWEHHEELHPIHAWLSTWKPENMFNPTPEIPYHPGAVQFFKDQDLWTDEAEENQEKNLEEAES